MTKPAQLLCLNPNCPTPTSRNFITSDLFIHKKCQNWIINQSFQLLYPINYHEILQHNITIQFGYTGINSIINILQLRNWPQQLNYIFQSLKNQVNYTIDLIKNQKISYFQSIYQQAQLAFSQIINIITKIYQDNQSHVVKQPKILQELASFDPLSLYQIQSATYFLKSNLMEDLNKLGNFIQSTGTNIKTTQSLKKRQAFDRAKQYFQNKSILVNDKIQKLVTTFNRQMIKCSKDTQKNCFKANCWLCQSISFSPKCQPSKLGCLQQLLNHLLEIHQNQILSQFVVKVMKCNIDELTFNTVIQKINNQCFMEIWVIDRENAGQVEKPQGFDRNKLWIEVVNKDNKNLAKGPFIAAESKRKDAADILITLLVYQICKCNTGKIILITKDHFGTTLHQIIYSIFGQEMQCIDPKDFISRINQQNNNIWNP